MQPVTNCHGFDFSRTIFSYGSFQGGDKLSPALSSRHIRRDAEWRARLALHRFRRGDTLCSHGLGSDPTDKHQATAEAFGRTDAT